MRVLHYKLMFLDRGFLQDYRFYPFPQYVRLGTQYVQVIKMHFMHGLT